MLTLGLASTILAYLLGSIPFGYLLVRWKKGMDIRVTGSGATGATNVMRTLGSAGFAATFLLDALKGAGAILLARHLTEADPAWIGAAAVAVILGHCFPVWLKFRGGKGVATAVGAFLTINPLATALALALFGVVVALWRFVSLGSIVAAVAFPLFLYFLTRPPLPILLGALGGMVIILIRHLGNMGRLLAGNENRMGGGKAVGSRQ